MYSPVTNPGVINKAFRDKLAAFLADFEVADENVFINQDPNHVPETPHSGDVVFTCSFLSGSFSGAEFDGGGNDELAVDQVAIVSVWIFDNKEQADRDDVFMTSTTDPGVFTHVGRVLKALSGQMLDDGEGSDYLNQPIFPQQNDPNTFDRSSRQNQVAFHLYYDWDINSIAAP